MNDTLEIVDLESLLEDSIHCEMDHSAGPTCTVEVVYIGTDCVQSIFLCKNSVDGKGGARDWMPHVRCSECLRPASECWKFRTV